MKFDIFLQIFEKYSNIKFNENPSSGRRIVARGRTSGQTDMTKLIVAFRNFTKVLYINFSAYFCGLLKTVWYFMLWQRYGWRFDAVFLGKRLTVKIKPVPRSVKKYLLARRYRVISQRKWIFRFSWSVNSRNIEWNLCQDWSCLDMTPRNVNIYHPSEEGGSNWHRDTGTYLPTCTTSCSCYRLWNLKYHILTYCVPCFIGRQLRNLMGH